MGKTFYYVRSKTDLSIEAEKRKKNFDLKKTLDTIREYCENGWFIQLMKWQCFDKHNYSNIFEVVINIMLYCAYIWPSRTDIT